MTSRSLFETLNYNLLNEIAEFLKPHEIVAILSVNKHLNKFWNSNITDKIFPGLESSGNLNPWIRWKLTKIKYLETENLDLPIKSIWLHKNNYPLKISFDPLKIILFQHDNFITWIPESDKTKSIKVGNKEDSAYLSAYENNNLAVLYTNSKLVFYLDNGIIRVENNLGSWNSLASTKLLYLKGGRYLIIANKFSEIAFIDSITGKIITKQKLESPIEKLKPLTRDTLVCLSGRQLWAVSPWLVKLLISFPGDMPIDFWYNKEIQKIIIHSPYSNYLFDKDPSVILKKFSGKIFHVNKRFFTVPCDMSSERLVVGEEDSQMHYEIPMNGEVFNIIGDNNMFVVHLVHFTPECQYIYFMYFYLWGERLPFYEKHFYKCFEILDFKFPNLIYMIINDDGINDVCAMRL
ncbi:unnamed protein product [Blepharisma stoltei]|uniref:F-box domain-containing protein n=1 Tax=Blepharisma stoltei TaxID=1481888 RepID=A0AAU9K4I6_9CILI|nr:unnamed protein product [Blepharisma stoltei]